MIRAFLIGAGATRAQYETAPLNSDFFRLLDGRYPHIYNKISKNIKKYIGDIPLSNISLENVMNLSNSFPQSIKNSFIQLIHLSIYKLISDSTNSTPNAIQDALNEASEGMPTLFNTLLNEDNRLNEEDFFLTLNYDLYLDIEVLSHKKFINYGIRKERIRKHDIPLDFDKQELSVYHLHGALNWYLIENTKEEAIFITDHSIIPSWRRGTPNICLMPPGNKDLNPILKEVWQISESRLMTADELIIVGCSLNQDDKELNNIISKFVKLKGANKVKIICSENDNVSIENYNKTIGTGYKIHAYGFNLIDVNGQNAIEFIFS